MNKKRFRYLALAAVLVFGAGLVSTLKSEVRFDHKVRNDFFSGFLGDHAAMDRAMKVCEAILAKDPKHAEALVWHGAGVYFQGGKAFQTGDRNKGMELAGKGLKEMEDAVALEPDNVGVRIPRGSVLMAAARAMPASSHSRSLLERGISDYERTLEIQKDYFDKLGTHPRGELLFGLADGYSRVGDETKAQSYFERIIRDLKDTPYAKRASLWLEKRSPLPLEQTTCIGCHTN